MKQKYQLGVEVCACNLSTWEGEVEAGGSGIQSQPGLPDSLKFS